MRMSEFRLKNRIVRHRKCVVKKLSKPDETQPKQLVNELVLENIDATPIGQLLKMIASLPEIRQEKVSGMRRRISDQRYDLDENLDTAIDRVLEEIIVETTPI